MRLHRYLTRAGACVLALTLGSQMAAAAEPATDRPRSGDTGGAAASSALTLWYRQPAERWVEALPVGNGRLGAMVFGGVAKERLQLNEQTMWSGGPQDA